MAYYGDDFTGSTDVLEALCASGIETVLFVEPPNEDMLRGYPNARAIGVAGTARTMSPAEMDVTLPGVFRALQRLRPEIVHYKVCSTFDSSPEIGSIGRAIDIGQSVFQNRFVPLVVGVPVLQRFCVFGNLFARSGLASAPYRLDRHPTMGHHPITPMAEADVRVHLSRQTSRPIGLVDVLALERGVNAAANEMAGIAGQVGSIVLIDTLTEKHLETVGRLLCDAQKQEQKPFFVAGSSGVEYALVKQWVPAASSRNVVPEVADRTVVVSGSCSPVTGRQIAWALEHGFVEVPLDSTRVVRSNQPEIDISDIARQIAAHFNAGRSVIVHPSAGSNDSCVATTHNLGDILGRILYDVVQGVSVRRVAVVGGDTSGRVARAMGIDALEFAGPLEPGAPLCVARSRDGTIDGLEIAFKGGQVGYDGFFGTLLGGQCKRLAVGATL